MKVFLFVVCFFTSLSLQSQDIPHPKDYFGYQSGDWHADHDQVINYFKLLSEQSPRMTLQTIGKTYEGRALVSLIVSAPSNINDLETVRQNHLDWASGKKKSKKGVVSVAYQGYSIHGNEASGTNAAIEYAYDLATKQDVEFEKQLEKVVVLIDPCMNPDGYNRFTTWVNAHRSETKNTDPHRREQHEAWPNGRTNHYWFDLNRDWLLAQHPESQARLRLFHDWKPNILTDHHEMGAHKTFFFQPGVPERTNPMTLASNQEMTAKIGKFHAKTLDKAGRLYYSEEDYDDFYYGKGSTYPDINGCVGILFEQASARGHDVHTHNGDLTFKKAVNNQFLTAHSTFEALVELRKDLLDYQQTFYKTAIEKAKKAKTKGFLVQSGSDESAFSHFVALLQQHHIPVHHLKKDFKHFKKENSFIVRADNENHFLVKAIFESGIIKQPNIFYDVSAWTVPMAFNLKYESVPTTTGLVGEARKTLDASPLNLFDENAIAIVIPWEDYYSPRFLYFFQNHGFIPKVATQPFSMNTDKGKRFFSRGSIIIPKEGNEKVWSKINTLSGDPAFNKLRNRNIYKINTGQKLSGVDLGSPSNIAIKKPKVLLLVGDGVNPYDAGEVWHLLDQRYAMPVTTMDKSKIQQLDSKQLSAYNRIVLVDGRYNDLSESTIGQLKTWVKNGGTIIAFKKANNFLIKNEIGFAKKLTPNYRNPSLFMPYEDIKEEKGKHVIGGAIFENVLDLSHPLCFGYEKDSMPIFRKGSTMLSKPNNPYAAPIRYTNTGLLSGYCSNENHNLLKLSVGVVVSRVGKGKVLNYADNPNFRAYWYATNKFFANALFFPDIIDGRTAE